MNVRSMALLLGVSALAAAQAQALASASRNATLRWVDGEDKGTASLAVQFDRPTPLGVEVRVGDAGLEVLLDGTMVSGDDLPDGIQVATVGTAALVKFIRPGLWLRSVRISAATATIVVGVPATDGETRDAYSVGVGDILSVSVYKNADLSGEFRVAPEGTITLPLVGDLPVVGRTEAEITADLTHRLASKYLVDPQVSVSVKTYQSQFVYVTGAVPRSSRVAIRPGLTLRGALAEAEVAIATGMSVELRRASGQTSMLDATALDASDAPAPQSGDVLIVQEQNYVTVYGEVRHPSRLTLTPGMTLVQAIAMAEGLTDWANKKKVQIIRKSPAGTEELHVNLNAVEDHEIPDPPLRPADVIMVGRRIL